MKDRNSAEIFMLIVSAVALVITMQRMMDGDSTVQQNSMTLSLAITLVGFTSIWQTLITIMRDLKKRSCHVYVSYSHEDEKLVKRLLEVLERQLREYPRNHVKFVTDDSIPLGSDIESSVRENIEKSDTIIVVVSEAYSENDWCLREFEMIVSGKKKMIPIVTKSFEDLKKLPIDISNVKALLLSEGESEKEFSEAISMLAKNLTE